MNDPGAAGFLSSSSTIGSSGTVFFCTSCMTITPRSTALSLWRNLLSEFLRRITAPVFGRHVVACDDQVHPRRGFDKIGRGGILGKAEQAYRRRAAAEHRPLDGRLTELHFEHAPLRAKAP